MLFILLFKQVISISQYCDHMILNQNEKYVIPQVYYKYSYNTNNENIIQDNKYIMFEHSLDIGQFVYGILDKNQLWLLSYKNGKFDLHLINLPIDIMTIRLQISIEQTNCYKIDVFQDSQIIIACFNECYNFYYVYNWKLRKLKQHKQRREKCKVETYNLIIIDEKYIIIQYDNFIQVLDYQFVNQCQLEFKHIINQIYYKTNLYIYTNQFNHELSEQAICNFQETSFTINAFIIIGNKYQISMDSENKININGVQYKINPKNLFFNDEYLIFQQFNTYYVYNYNNLNLITSFQENEKSKIFVNIDLLDIYIVYDNKIKLINIQEEAYQIINSQYSLEISLKESLYLDIRHHNRSNIMLSQQYYAKVVISQNQTQIRMGPFDGGNVQYKFLQNNNQDYINVDVKVINYKIKFQQECIFFQIYNQAKYNLYICQYYNLTLAIYKCQYSTSDMHQWYNIDQALTKNDSLIIQDKVYNIIHYFILRVADDHFKLYKITNNILNFVKQLNFDQLIVFDTDFIYYTINDIIYRYVISQQVIELIKYRSTQIFIDQKNYLSYENPYLNYYCQNNQLSQQIYVGQKFIDIKSFDYSITVIMKGEIQLYHRLNKNKILYIGNLDLYDNEIDETCQFISDKELLYVRCYNRLLIFDSQQSLQQSLIRNFVTTHSFPLNSASKLHICFEEQVNQISCYSISQLFEFTYQFLQKIHSIKVELQIIAYNKYNKESISQQFMFQNDFQYKQDHFIKYQAFKGQTTFKIDIELNSIRQQNYLYSDFYELTRSIQTHQAQAITSLNFIVLIENDDFKVYETDYVNKQLSIKALHLSVVHDTILYQQQNQSLYFYECNIYLQCNFTQQLALQNILQLRVLQFGNRIIIQQNNTFNIYEYQLNSKQIKKVTELQKVFQVYDIYEDTIVYLIDKKLKIQTNNSFQEYDLQTLMEIEDLAIINQLVIINNNIDVCISDGYKALIYRFETNQYPYLKAVLFKEYLFGQRLQFQTLQIKNSILIALSYSTQINLYNYQDIKDIQYLYPIKIIYSPSGFIQLKGMQLFIIKGKIVVVFKQGMDIRIMHLSLEQYLVIEPGVQNSQIVELKIKNQSQLSILLNIEIQETDYYLVFIIILILIFVSIKYLQIKD